MTTYAHLKLPTNTYKPLVIRPVPFSIHRGQAGNLFISMKTSSEHNPFHWLSPTLYMSCILRTGAATHAAQLG